MHTTYDIQQLQIEAKFFKGLADKSRLAILESLVGTPRTVSELVAATQLSQPNVSTHLSCLLDCGLVKKERRGQWVLYRIAAQEVGTIISLMRQVVAAHSKELYDCTRY